MSKPADADTKVDEIKAQLRQWLEPRLQHDHAPAALAILETALELYIADLGTTDARKLVRSAFVRAAARPSSQPMQAGLAAVANMDTKSEG